MQSPVARDDVRASNIEAGSIHVADVTAGLFDHQRTGRNVPLFEAELPESVRASAGDVREVECRGTGAAHALRARHEGLPECEVVAAAFTPVVGEAGREQRQIERRDATDVNRAAVQRCAAATLRDEALLP